MERILVEDSERRVDCDLCIIVCEDLHHFIILSFVAIIFLLHYHSLGESTKYVFCPLASSEVEATGILKKNKYKSNNYDQNRNKK
jgi:hypothetical protein